METKFIQIEEKENYAVLKINRPEVYNALNAEAKFELIGSIRRLQKNQNIRCLILTGEGKAFCSGQDLNDRTVQSSSAPVDLGKTLETEWNPLVMAIKNTPFPVIAALNGVCAGAGLSVATACDLIISAPGVKFVSGFSKLGLTPDAGSSHTFVHHLGYAKTLEFFLFNQPLKAQDLFTAGLVNAIDENFLDLAHEWATQIGAMAPLSLKFIKENLRFAQDESFNRSIERETYSQRFLGNSQDYAEGLKAFFEKRAPKFQGR